MSEEQLKNEKMYLATMNMAKDLLVKGIITEEEYHEIDTIFTNKYAPSLGRLFSNIRLI
ncbi:MAG: hypothetical protein LUI12_12795 [Clostridiales bacterium]|nr:hypothetical protein [Clostridiales bacterium]